CLIARKTDPARQQRPALKNLLRLGLYQIFWLDRIPPHAAVHETVELAKHSGYGSQAGFINAVLRGYLRETDAIKKILADMKISQPALGWSHPEWLVDRWRARYGEEKTRQLLEWNNTPPKTYARVNSLKFSTEVGDQRSEASPSLLTSAGPKIKDAGDLLTFWRNEGVEYDFFTRDWTGENLVFELKAHPPFNKLASLHHGWFYLQDPSTLLAPVVLGAQPGENILDLCAAPGGKTTFIAQMMNNEGKITACDIEPNRLRLVRENCARLGVTNVQMPLPSFVNPQTAPLYDRILIDAPCSNTGVMRRRVDLRWRIQAPELERLRTIQLDLLRQAAPKLKPGGVLVYSTCSLEPEENTEVIKQFLAANPSFRLESERQLLPFVDGVDGAYVAKLKRD
ncbi:MAG TPA: 16S rRNA (cytosine(967)-C(5))-methyltransferase RsmB, partial [Verrucomicrobiae bacterium]